MNNIYHYLFHYNPYRMQWVRIHREAYQDYMNGIYDPEKVTFDESFMNLLTPFNDGPIPQKESKEA